MAERSIVIIGAGVAGLSAGCYGRMNGFRTTVLERGARAGGLCTAWSRGGYLFDGCIRWLTGTVAQDRFHRVWQELGVVPRCEMLRPSEEFLRVVAAGGEPLVVSRDVERFAAHLRARSPADGGPVSELAELVRLFAARPTPLMPPRELRGDAHLSTDVLRFLPMVRLLRRANDDGSLAGFAARFHDPFLRKTLAALFETPNFSVLAAFLVLAGLHRGDGAVPRGGSLSLAAALEDRYRGLGGELRLEAPVAEIVTQRGERGRAAGVRLLDGEEVRADVVVSAADGRTTLFDLLGGRHLTQELRRWYAEARIFSPLVHVSLGVGRDLSEEPPLVRHLLDEPLEVAGEPVRVLNVAHHGPDPSFAPAGKSAVVVSFASSHRRWQELGARRADYLDEKRRAVEQVLSALDRRSPGLLEPVEVTDVATPLTTERYTGNWQGCPEGWALTHEMLAMLIRGTAAPRTLPGLRDFYMAGHWVEPGGGLPMAALSGREVVQLVCHALRQPFETTLD